MTENTEPTTEFPKDRRLFNLGIWAGTFSWLVLLLGLAQTGLNFIKNTLMFMPENEPLFGFLMLLTDASYLLRAIISWFILQAIKHVLFLMIDIKEFLHKEKATD